MVILTIGVSTLTAIGCLAAARRGGWYRLGVLLPLGCLAGISALERRGDLTVSEWATLNIVIVIIAVLVNLLADGRDRDRGR